MRIQTTSLQTWMFIAFVGGGGETTDDPYRPGSRREHQGKPILKSFSFYESLNLLSLGGKKGDYRENSDRFPCVFQELSFKNLPIAWVEEYGGHEAFSQNLLAS